MPVRDPRRPACSTRARCHRALPPPRRAQAIFAGEDNSELDQLACVFRILGTPTQANWPNHHELPAFVAFKPTPPVPLDEVFKERASDDAVSFVSALLALDPERRLAAPAALEHSYFRRPPAATPPAKLPLGTNLIVRP